MFVLGPQEIIEEDARQRQNNWQSHTQKALKKLKTKQSIFRTSDNPEGKVGVTGSGALFIYYLLYIHNILYSPILYYFDFIRLCLYHILLSYCF